MLSILYSCITMLTLKALLFMLFLFLRRLLKSFTQLYIQCFQIGRFLFLRRLLKWFTQIYSYRFWMGRVLKSFTELYSYRFKVIFLCSVSWSSVSVSKLHFVQLNTFTLFCLSFSNLWLLCMSLSKLHALENCSPRSSHQYIMMFMRAQSIKDRSALFK